jgi:uncharacterized membrane protein
MLLALAFLIGVIAGLRTMTAPAAVAWAASLGWMDVSHTPLAFMGYRWTPWLLTLLAVVELVGDQLPAAPSRKIPMQFGARVASGALCGATLGAPGGALVEGLVVGVVGAVVGTLGGATVRARLASSFGKDLPAALIEDVVAIGGALAIVVSIA